MTGLATSLFTGTELEELIDARLMRISFLSSPSAARQRTGGSHPNMTKNSFSSHLAALRHFRCIKDALMELPRIVSRIPLIEPRDDTRSPPHPIN